MGSASSPQFETIDGRLRNGDLVRSVTIRSQEGYTATILTYGLRLVRLSAPKGPNIALALTDTHDLDHDKAYVGAIVGRTANRVRAGVEGSSLGRSDSSLVLNEAEEHHIHGGKIGWSQRLWMYRQGSSDWAEFQMLDPDGQQGYSGSIECRVKFWIKKHALSIRIWTKNIGNETVVANPTLHPYFDLSGGQGKKKGAAFDYLLWTDCDRRLEVDKRNVPTGDIEPVDGTEFDFRDRDRIEREYDCFLLAKGDDPVENAEEKKAKKVAELLLDDPNQDASVKKKRLELWTDQPGFQLYTANGFKGTEEKGFRRNCAICLEPSGYLDAANHPHFPKITLDAEEEKRSNFTYKFFT